ncbi:PQQ-like beta-propeller repeat protein [Streptomyces sp. JB150]|uniref:PQQ-like beta-propeller repeat protein n=1 Tax=Streptomyces sp. JB150 TaxID=2714844 RepID=UPI001F0DF1E7|nr:PQQ-like beta-propeller repeat protein [Streptomyces sp. JB150]
MAVLPHQAAEPPADPDTPSAPHPPVHLPAVAAPGPLRTPPVLRLAGLLRSALLRALPALPARRAPHTLVALRFPRVLPPRLTLRPPVPSPPAAAPGAATAAPHAPHPLPAAHTLPAHPLLPPPLTGRASRLLPARRLLTAALALALAAPLLAGAHQVRPAPYGDRLTVHARVAGTGAAEPRIDRAAVEARDPRTGALRWRHAREGRRPLAVLPARGEAITLWDDGLVTATDGHRVRWHRALPAAAGWLRARGGTGVLRLLGRGMLAVVTPRRVTAYRLADGDLRWVLPARPGCAFAPERAVGHGRALLLAQPCGPSAAWTAQLVAVDDLGRIAPDRRPLGNDRAPGPYGGRTEHPNAEKVVAPPR